MRLGAIANRHVLSFFVMTGLDPVIHGSVAAREIVDGRIKSGHDDKEEAGQIADSCQNAETASAA
jgi:hypothetical protein